MRQLLLELYHKRIFPSTPINSFYSFLSYIVVTPLMLGFEKDFSCHSHLGLIRIPPLFPFYLTSFPRNDKGEGIGLFELSYLSADCFTKILLLQMGGHRVIQISRVFCGFPMLQLLYQFGRLGRLNIPLGGLVLNLLCGIHLATSSSNSSQNPTTSTTSLPLIVYRTSSETEWFHVPTSIGYSSPFVSLFQIPVSISSQD